MKRYLTPLLALAAVPGLFAAMPAGPNPLVLPLWEGTPPNAQPAGKPFERVQEGKIVWVRHVSNPSIEVRLPARGNATGQAVVVCPGGGYGGLAYDWEGSDFAGWLNSHGIAAVVLTYRLPVDGDVAHQKWLVPLLDAQRAIRLTRAHAAEWGINPAKVGIMGFSAGGHLASTAGTRFDAGDANAADPVDRLSSRPDFLILVYPVISMQKGVTHGGSRNNLLGENPPDELVTRYSNELQVTDQTPPTFLVHAGDDPAVPVQNTLLFYDALLKHKVPAELHIYPHGGHGFSFGFEHGHLRDWTDACAHWLSEL
ncbi:MAG TPA: alpha/beta hydrolase [Lacunisphaera sp.]|jgi:acetyl esterase/lipase|nr:alpha/beta hydrolase [Lacunisphaera sp.]